MISKKILLVSALFLFLIINQTQAAGLVPCGGSGEEDCELCDIFVMIANIFDFVVIKLVPIIAVLMIVVGGVMFFFGGTSPKLLQNGKDIITSTIIGLLIIFSAYLIVGTILSAVGLADWTKDLYKNWWQEGFFQIPGC